MNMKIGNKAAPFNFWENPIRIFFACSDSSYLEYYRRDLHTIIFQNTTVKCDHDGS